MVEEHDSQERIQLDEELVKRVQAGDTAAFDLLVRKYQHRIAALIGRYVSDWSEVQDVAQETFIRAYRALAQFRGDAQFYTWLYRIAVNTAKKQLLELKRDFNRVRRLALARTQEVPDDWVPLLHKGRRNLSPFGEVGRCGCIHNHFRRRNSLRRAEHIGLFCQSIPGWQCWTLGLLEEERKRNYRHRSFLLAYADHYVPVHQ